MSYELNEKKLLADKSKYIFLIDSSALLKYFKVDKSLSFSIFGLIENSKFTNFYITNNVFVEMSQKEGILNTELFGPHIINSEFSFSSNYKENKFIYEDRDELKYIVLNKVSGNDYAQIHLCQQHKKLNLVANDRKLIKSAKCMLGENRAGGPADLARLMVDLHPEVKILDTYYNEILKNDCIQNMNSRWISPFKKDL